MGPELPAAHPRPIEIWDPPPMSTSIIDKKSGIDREDIVRLTKYIICSTFIVVAIMLTDDRIHEMEFIVWKQSKRKTEKNKFTWAETK